MERSRQQLTKTNGRTRPKKLYNDSDDERLDLKIDSIREKTRTPCFVYVLTFFSSLGGFLIGYDTYIISGAKIWLKKEFSLTYMWQEIIVAVTLGVAAIFALIGGILNDRLGRRSVILCACIVFTAAAILMGIANDKYMLLSGRILTGIAVGQFIYLFFH
ncbi:hypothetical protein ACF0H5_014714 [Mactra antiquata]